MERQLVQRVFRGLVLFTLALHAGCWNDDGADKRKLCERYRDHLVELRLGDAPNAKVAADHRDLIRQSLGEEFVSSCEAEMTSDQIRCGMAADDPSDVFSCGTESK